MVRHLAGEQRVAAQPTGLGDGRSAMDTGRRAMQYRESHSPVLRGTRVWATAAERTCWFGRRGSSFWLTAQVHRPPKAVPWNEAFGPISHLARAT